MGSLSLKKKISTSLATKYDSTYYIRFKGPAGITFGNFFNAGIAAVMNSGGAYNFYFDENLNNPTTYLTDGGDWYYSSGISIITNNIIPINTIVQIYNDFADFTINFGGNIENYFSGKTSIKKQNLSILKSLNYYPPQESIYTFKSATTNLLGTILNYAQFEPYTDSISIYTQGNLDGFYASFYTDGSSFIYDDYTTNANNFVIPANSLLIFSTSYDINITVGGGAIIQKYYSGKINLNTYIANDPDARNYISAVETADGSPLEASIKKAIDNFIVGCKSDGIWDAIKSSCILSGARTLNGALVSLKGTSPTNMGFVSGDYDRKTGLLGNGSSKYLISNRNITSDPQNNKHLSAYATTGNTRDAVRVLIGSAIGNNIGASSVFTNVTNFNARISYGSPPAGIPQAGLINGLQGATRSNLSTVDYYFNNASGSYANTSFGQSASDINIFANASAAVGSFSNARIAFYSIGENINLQKLDNRVTDYINAISSI